MHFRIPLLIARKMRRTQPDLPNVSEAIRRLVEAGLEAGKKRK
jgi:hypothetical protein